MELKEQPYGLDPPDDDQEEDEEEAAEVDETGRFSR